MITKEEFLYWVKRDNFRLVEDEMGEKGFFTKIDELPSKYRLSFTSNNTRSIYKPFYIDVIFINNKNISCSLDDIDRLYLFVRDECDFCVGGRIVSCIQDLLSELNSLFYKYFNYSDYKFELLEGEVIF